MHIRCVTRCGPADLCACASSRRVVRRLPADATRKTNAKDAMLVQQAASLTAKQISCSNKLSLSFLGESQHFLPETQQQVGSCDRSSETIASVQPSGTKLMSVAFCASDLPKLTLRCSCASLPLRNSNSMQSVCSDLWIHQREAEAAGRTDGLSSCSH